MIQRDSIVCGGGWKERKDYFIKIKAVACAILFFPVTLIVAGRIEWWGILPVVVAVGSWLLFKFEKPTLVWGPPDARMSMFEDNQTTADIPKYDPRNLY